MKILWTWNSSGGEFSFSGNNKEVVDSFDKHKDSMKKFRQAHPKVETSKPKEDTAVRRSGNRGKTDLEAVVPIQRVRIARYVCN